MEQYSAPGGIKIESIIIENFDGSKQLQILPIVFEFNIFESIQKPFLSASFVIDDALALTTHFPIIGQEIIYIKFKTPGDAFLKSIDLMLRVISIQEYKRENIREASYILNCVSPSMILDMNSKVRKAYTNMTIDQMAVEILTNYLQGDFAVVDPTEGNRTFVIPNMSPSNAILFLARQAKSSLYQSSPYFFFETCDGFKFQTSNDMINPKNRSSAIQGSSIDKYYGMDFDFSKGTKSPRDMVTGGSGGTRGLSTKPYEYLKLKSFVFHNLGNYYTGLKMGYIENKVNFFDPITSFYEEKRYNYITDNGKFEKTSQSQASPFLAPSNPYTKDGDAFVLFEPTNIKQVNAYPNDQNYDILNDKIGAKNVFENINATISIPGDSEKRAGDVIDLEFPEYGSTDDVEKKINKFISGEYLILSVRHIYNASGYETIMNVSKNAFEHNIDTVGNEFSTSVYDENARGN